MFEVAGVGLATAFLAGLVSFLSPCVLPLVPGYVSYVAGHSLAELSEPGFSTARLAALRLGASFVLGFSLVFLALGASATALGQLLLSYRGEADAVAGAIVIVFGLHLMGAFRLGLMNREWRFTNARLPSGGLGSLLFGAAFGFGWTPCIGPILGSILVLGASRATVGEGVVLLSVYSLGLAVPFLLVAAFTARFMRGLGALRRLGRRLQIGAGAFLVLVGVAMATGSLTSFGTWMLKTFPGLQYLVI